MRYYLLGFAALMSMFLFLYYVPNLNKLPDYFFSKIVFYPNSEKLMEVVNNWRISQNLQTYVVDQRLCKLASERANETLDIFSHGGFVNRIKNKSFGFDYKGMAENLSVVGGTEQNYLSAWLNSPEHKADLLHDYKYSCIACKKASCAQIFANF